MNFKISESVKNGLSNVSFKKLKIPQWPVKSNSILDRIASWIDKTFFGSEYNLTTEKVMIVALCTNVLGLYRIYAGRKIAAVISWIFLIFSFITRDWMFLFTLPWFVIDLIRIFRGNYGRLKSNQAFDLQRFKALIAYKARAKGKAISGSVSIVTIGLIIALAPPSQTTSPDPNMTTSVMSVVSQSDSATTSTAEEAIAASELSTASNATSTEAITEKQSNVSSAKKTTKKTTASSKKAATTTKKAASTTKATTTTKKTTTTTTKKSTAATKATTTTTKKPTTTTKATTTTKKPTTTTKATTTTKKPTTTTKATTTTQKPTTTAKATTTTQKPTTTTAKPTTTTTRATTTRRATSVVHITSDPDGTVWVADRGTKYHSNPNCSNMRSPVKVTVEHARRLGRTPCSRCY